MKDLFVLMAFLCLSLSSWGQTMIKGQVIDSESASPLPYVQIANRNGLAFSQTNDLGQFEIAAKVGKDSLEIQLLGYSSLVVLATENLHISLSAEALAVDELLVSASRSVASRSTSPVAISSISAQDIKQTKATTIDQLVNQLAGVNMVDLGNEQHSMSIRRPVDYGASYLYMEDGLPIRASGVFNHNALLEINMADVGRIELIRGPASSLYGSEAIGGAINFISSRGSLTPQARLGIQGSSMGYARADLQASTSFNKRLGLQLNGYYAQQRNGLLAHSDFHKMALNIGGNYQLDDKTSLSTKLSILDYHSEMRGSLDSAAFFGRSYDSDQTFTYRKVKSYRARIDAKRQWNSNSFSKAIAYFRKNGIEQNPSYRVSDDYKPWTGQGDPLLAHGQINDNSFISWGLLGQHQENWAWQNAQLIVGGQLDYSPNTYEAQYIQIQKTEEGLYNSYTTTDSSLADYTAHLLNTAAYMQYQMDLFEGLKLTAALRFDYFNYSFDNKLGANAYTAVEDGSNSFYRLTPKLGLNYNFSKTKGIYLNYGQGFVPPQVSALYVGQRIPMLDAVYYQNYELGSYLGIWKNRLRIELSAYYMSGENEIISVLQDDGTTIRQNAGGTAHYGLEYGLRIQLLKDLNLSVQATNSIHRFTDFEDSRGNDFSGNDMPLAPKFFMNSMLSYQPSFVKGLSLRLEWRQLNKYYMDQANSKEYNGFDCFNLRLGYQHKNLEVWAHLMNLSNELYATVASSSLWGESYSLGRPRYLQLGVAYTFK
ncbi:TonB-dependent receptor [Saprospira grandis]|uniref:TonB-dependent receptor n=1 Tax=Saprospira grandis TaxID=1008 RepID=UPI0022DD42BE|nr:TonB-dependent receptor [Saprospira grandis]WBM75169.1 TonB-dependent receptor [Saprospira grandis]